ncbi:hypothetical protein OIU84_019351 [Salix udensis]|uniref:Uncharacterized protein n=1 Tax=Salix udensis TaxID=889485 RepID=A0AAD6PKV7_9ROSI|nr:hypothetical protein OIU84_019351 [Salix udensis]
MDDFGDLYLDVVIQASSVINSLPNSNRKGFEVGRERNGNGNGGDGYEDAEGEEGCGGGFVGAKNGVECDVSGNGVKGVYHLPHLQYKNMRPYGSSFSEQ